ncbi:translocation/assembly module TamB domain-containing protein [Pleionea litopenaei]|uniref:Translocation/assembly module TamB domain-containing protein n=1 Tax=Pleionea litopenaei TaxID=3070815 RepID=A0AA51X8A4_9GAMM|nr:translocation/assembly module TamB domain-containing protein [Pleionea sp. HL-JVS1]WMS88734.1 translocation/assembly module TamB domain-containing protein [Pleionea sp. HL-JVS1]
MKSILRTFLLLILGLFIVSAIAFGWVYNTTEGLQFALNRAQPYLPKELQLGTVQGTLAHGTQIDSVEWRSESMNISGKNISIKCHWLELLFDQVWCSNIHSENINIVTYGNEQESFSSDLHELPIPPDVRLPWIIRLDEVEANSITLLSQSISSQQTLSETQIDDVLLEKFLWQGNALSVENIEAQINQVNLKMSAELSPQDGWPATINAQVKALGHALTLDVSGELLKQSKGKLVFQTSELSEETVRAQGDFELDYNAGKPKLKLLTTLADARLDRIASELVVVQATNQLSLDWPRLESKLSSQFTFNKDELELNQSLQVQSLLDWRHLASGNLVLAGNLEQTVDQYMSLDQIIRPNVPVSLPTQIDLDWRLSNGALELTKGNFQLSEISATVLASANVNKLPYEDLSVSIKTNMDKQPDWLITNIEHLNSVNKLSHKNTHSPLEISSNGSLANITMPQIRAEKLSWNYKSNEKLNVAILLDEAYVELNDLPTLKLHDLQLNANGLLKKHQFQLSTKINQADFEATGEGVLDTGWTLKDFRSTLKHNDQSASITSTQMELLDSGLTIDNLCLQQRGYWCNTGSLVQSDWHLSSSLKLFDVATIQSWSDVLGFSLPFELAGVLNGSATVSGKSDQINQFDIDLKSPVLSFQDTSSALVFTEMVFKSSHQNKTYQLAATWEHFAEQSQWSHFELSSAAGSGQLIAQVNTLNDWSIALEQPQIATNLSSTTSEDSMSFLFEIPISNFQLNLSLQQDKLLGDTYVQLFDNDWAKLDWQSNWPMNTDSRIKGNGEFSLTQFDWLKRWQSRIDELDINWQHKTTFSGTLAHPNFTGNGQLKVQEFVMEELGLNIKDSYLDIQSVMDTFTLQGTLLNQQGKLDLNGEVKISPELSGFANLKGDKLTIIDSKEQKIVVSPKLFAEYKDNHLNVNGDLLIDEAKISVNKIPQNKVSVSEDQILLVNPKLNPSPFTYRVALNLALGETASFTGLGLSSDITGKLKLLAETGQAIKLEGQLRLINGKFEAYKQALEIEQGQLIFLGAADNPGIQIAASRKIDDIKVGVYADGSLLDPKLTLFSEPAMPEENIVALLLTGRSIESLSSNEGNALANAVIGLGVEGANRIAGKIGQALGIESIKITSSSTAETSRVNIETQVNERLSVGYGTTIDSQNQTQTGWIIEYKLTPKLSFEAISGEEISTSLTYRTKFGRDKKNEKESEN